MAESGVCWLIFTFLLFSGPVIRTHGVGVGINYGQIANNLPSPTQVAHLLQSISISKVKLYDADPNVLQAFSNTNIEFIVGVGNEHLENMTDLNKAISWVTQYIQPYIALTKITCITVGNEVFSGNDTAQMSNLLPAMQNIRNALASLGLQNQVNVTTAHSFNILGVSYPPSGGVFRQDLLEYLAPVLNFHSQTKSPFLINAYPYFAYKGSPDQVALDYVLFQPNAGIVDPNSNLHYDNMLYAQIDSVYSALAAQGHPDLQVRISETGWPSRGDADEVGATPENAKIYNGNLLTRIAMNQGTPMKPSVPLDTYVFALFNEDMKPGPTSERNYGLFHPDGTPVYNLGFQGTSFYLASSADIKVGIFNQPWRFEPEINKRRHPGKLGFYHKHPSFHRCNSQHKMFQAIMQRDGQHNHFQVQSFSRFHIPSRNVFSEPNSALP